MSQRRLSLVEERVAMVARRVGIDDDERAVRFLEFCAVGGAGVFVDLGTTFALLGAVHYLAANTTGFLIAVSFNFAGNWLITYRRPDGTLWKQYGSYVGLHATTFAMRAVVLTALVEAAGAPPGVATIVGVGVAAVANFLGTEGIFGGVGRLWFDAVAATNQLAHLIYTSRLRQWLHRVGLYGPLFGAYVALLGRLYRDREHTIEIGDAQASLLMERPPEVVSVLHTLEKERAALAALVEEVHGDDIVWDVGANLGVYACLLGDVVDEVVAVEPYAPTASRLDQNLVRNDVDFRLAPFALGATADTVDLGIERAEVGTQTPVPGATGRTTVEIQQFSGAALVERDVVPPPTVLKVDVEGAECEVLAGLDGALQECRLCYVETHGNTAAVRAELETLGFDVDEVRVGTQTYLRGDRSCN